MSLTLRVYIVCGGGAEVSLMRSAGHTVVDKIEDANALLLTGGADIPATLYNQKNVASYYSAYHDTEDYAATKYWKENPDQFIIVMGICRGGQWLNCESGGNMWQHVNNHSGRHKVRDLRTGEITVTNSVHHQMMRPGPDAEVIAVSEPLATIFIDDTGEYSREDGQQDIEVLWYPTTRALCFQAHPEYGHPDTTKFFLKLLEEKLSLLAQKD